MNCDVLLTGARIVDGSGNPWTYGDVALRGDSLLAIAPPGHLPREGAREVVEAAGHVVAPGFIDIQSHSIGPFMTDGRSVSKVTQGVTTEIMGELWTPAPFGGRRSAPFGWASLDPEIEAQTRRWTRFSHWMEFLSRRGVAVNFGSFVGGGTVREFACGMDAGAPSEDELDLMRRITAEAMEDGALGIATALIYPPNCYSPDHELIELARVVARYGGLYVTHMRSEGDRLLESLEDTIALSRESHAPVEIYHLKATGGRNWSKVPEMIARIDRARADGVDVTADMYPYVASGTGLTVMLPYWVSEGGRLYESLEDPEIRRRLRSEMLALEGQASPHTVSRDYVVPVGFKQPENQHYVGRNLMEIAEARGESWPDTVIALLRSEQQRIGTVFFTISEPNVRLQLQQPWIKVSTDAGGISPEGQEQPVHPRGYGTYPRVLGKYVREERALTLEHAVRIMTSSVADRLGLRDRGLLRPGMKADVVVLDPHTVADRATFTDSHQLSTGIRDVWVNGVRVLQQGVHTGALPGRFVGGSGRR